MTASLPAPTSLGAWLNLTDPLAAYLIADAGFDWLCVDEQHGGAVETDTLSLLRSTAAVGTSTFVRVAANRSDLIGRALDSGARGVIVPMVSTVAEAESAVRWCRYPPLGQRSWGPSRAGYAAPAGGTEATNREVRCLVMVETVEAVENVEDIAAVPGIDGIFVGPFDLSLAYGIAVDELLGDEADEAPLARVALACRKNGIVAGAYAGSPERTRLLSDRGYTLLAIASDTELLSSGARSALTGARTLLG